MKSYMESRYCFDNKGNFKTLRDYDRAKENGDVRELSNGNFYDDSTRIEYDSRGDVVDNGSDW